MTDYNNNPYGLSDDELNACDKLIDNGFGDVNKDARELTKSPMAREYLDHRREREEENLELSYNKKLKKLDSITNFYLPDNLDIRIRNADIEERRQIALEVKIAIDAICKLNLMQGHNAAEKYITTSIKYDFTELKQSLEDLTQRCNQ